MELYRKYRPQTFREFTGNRDTISSIRTKLDQNKIPHALLLTGASGTGKTTLGRIIAEKIGATGLDYHEVDSADFRGIDTVRKIRRQMQYAPSESKNVVWLLDECALLGSGGASVKNLSQSALLKALEDPPDHCYFILCTTDPQMLMKTIKSRCTHYEMETLTDRQIQMVLTRIIKKEKVKIPKEIVTSIAKASKGKPRKALTILEKVIHLPVDKMQIQIQNENEQESSAFKLAQLLFKGSSWKAAIPILKGLKNENPETIRRVINSYMITVISKGSNEKAGDILFYFKEPFYDDGMTRLWFICHQYLNGFEL